MRLLRSTIVSEQVVLLPKAAGKRFATVDSSEVVQRVTLEQVASAQRGVRQLSASDRTALAACWRRLREAAVQSLRDRTLAKQAATRARDAAKRLAGRTDLTVLTVPLMQEELRARRLRGEEIDRIPTTRPEALAALQAARRAQADIPTPPPDPAAAQGARSGDGGDSEDGGDGGGRGNGSGGGRSGCVHSDGGSLLGRRCLSLHQGRFYPATVAMYSPTATKWRYLVHWDDGVRHHWDGEPDSLGPDGQSSVQLLRESRQRCICMRCVLTDPTGTPVFTGSIPRHV